MKRLLNQFEFGSLALLTGTLIVCLFFSEVIIRWHIFGDDAWSYSQIKSVRHIGVSGLLQPSAFQDILWELRPNINTTYKLKPFRTNPEGLRDKNYSKVKPAGTFRIAVLGDSFTMGEGIAIEDAYHTLLEERFNALGEKRDYEFINFGVAGYSLIQYVTMVQHKVLEYQPDLILIGFCAANDSKLPNLKAFTEPYRVKPTANGIFHLYSFELIGDGYKYFYKKLRDRHSGYNADPQYVETNFRNLSALTAAHQIPIVIAYIDNKAASTDFDMVRSAALRYGFDFIDGTVGFPEKVLPEYIIYKTDNHPNAAANRIFADSLFTELKNQIALHSLRAVKSSDLAKRSG